MVKSNDKKHKLTMKQKKFADLFIELGNASEAAIKAGYSKKTARAIASQNLDKPIIKEYIQKVMEQKDKERVASQDEILQFLTDVMRGSVREQIPLLDGDGVQVLARKDMSAKDRVKAAELLGKRYMMWKENQTIDVMHQVQIIDDIGDEDE